jgi:uncharacterized flavoprotein (TIGR03862 family)
LKALKIIIVGTGPAALMAGTALLKRGHKVHFFEQKKAAGRKFLVAGHGGFNLSNSLAKNAFLEMYDKEEIKQMVSAFDTAQLRDFLASINIPTYVGSSGKIFPEEHIKPITVLQKWLAYLHSLGAVFYYEHSMLDFAENTITFLHKGEETNLHFDRLILALGGASWAKTGSDGTWRTLFENKNIPVKPFQASNSGFNIRWTEALLAYQGTALKNIKFQLSNKSRMGESVVTRYGLEGAPIYFLNAAFRAGSTHLKIDTKPTLSEEQIVEKLLKAKNITAGLKQIKIAPFFIALLKEQLDKESYLDTKRLAHSIKNIELCIDSLRPIDEVISTVGGLSFEAVRFDLSLKKFQHIYCCGEMLDWDAPTGGYLLQACFASGYWVGQYIK